jgi:serine/threonine-protein kinase RsbW
VRLKSDVKLDLALVPELSSAAEMRAGLRRYLAERSLAETTVCELVLAAEEAFTNALLHGGGEGPICVSASVHRGRVSILVRDRGCGFDARRLCTTAIPSAARSHGRGLFLMSRLTDGVEIKSGRRGTRVRMVKDIA